MKSIAWTTLALIALLAVLLGLLVACESPAAQRETARAERIRAEADAYARKQAADTAAAAERAALRQMERDAAHERTLETLPFVLSIGGGVLVLCLALFVWWDVHSQRQMPATSVEPQLARHEWAELIRALEDRDRALWHALATLARRQGEGQPSEATERRVRYLVTGNHDDERGDRYR